MKKKKLKLKKETKKSIAIVINMILIILGILGYISHIKEYGRFDFQYYTLDCNLFAMIVEMILIYYMTLEDKVPKWVQLLKYMSVLALVVTFLVVVFILEPQYEYGYDWFLFHGSSLYYHTLVPILGFISFVFFEDYKFNKKDSCLVMIFTIIYAIIAITANAIGAWDGPYPFLRVRSNPWHISVLWTVAILGGALALSFLINLLKKVTNKSRKEKEIWK